MKPLSMDLRHRVVAALQTGQTYTQVAHRFCVSQATVGRLARQWREEGHLEPLPVPGRPRAIAQHEQETLRALLADQREGTLESLSRALEEQIGKRVSSSALHRNLKWLGYSHKKSRVSLVNETP